MEELIKTVSEKAGITAEQAKTAVASVLDFVKTKVPAIGDQLTALVNSSTEGGTGGVVDAVKKKLGLA